MLGILLGFACAVYAVVLVYPLGPDREHFGHPPLYGLLGVSAGLLVGSMGACLLYTSYRMLRGRSYRAIRVIASSLAALVFIWALRSSTIMSVSEGLTGHAQGIRSLGFWFALFVFLLLNSICEHLLNRVSKAAHGPDKISETSPPADQQGKDS